MTRSIARLMVVSSLLLAAGAGMWELDAGAPPQPSAPAGLTDRFGDPLPEQVLARLGTVRWRHGDRISAVAFLPGGKELLSSGLNGSIKVWDIASGREVRRFGNLAGLGNSAYREVRDVLSPDRQLIAQVYPDNTIELWHLPTGQKRVVLPKEKGRIETLAFLPDSKSLVAVDTEGLVRYWETAAGQELRRFNLQHSDPNSRQYGHLSSTISPDGKTLALGRRQDVNSKPVSVIWLYDLGTGKELKSLRRPTERWMNRLVFAPDGKSLACPLDDATVLLYDLAAAGEPRQLGQPVTGPWRWSRRYAGFSPNGQFLLSGGDDTIHLWHLSTGKEIRRFGSGFDAFAFAPDRPVLATARSSFIQLWDLTTGAELAPLDAPRDGIAALHVSADGETALALEWGPDAVVRQFDPATGAERRPPFRVPRADIFYTLLFSPDGRLVCNVSARGVAGKTAARVSVVSLWDVASGKELRQIEVPADENQLYRAAFGGDGKRLALCGRQGLGVWDTDSGKQVLRIAGSPREEFEDVALSPDGAVLAAILSDQSNFLNRQRRLQFWDAAGKPLAQATPPAQASWPIFSPDGRSLACYVDKSGVIMWDVATARERRRFPAESWSLPRAFSPDGRCLLIAGPDDIQVWEIATGRVRARFRGHQSTVSCAAFSPDGARLITGSWDSTALVWDLAGFGPGKPPAEAELPPREIESLWNDLADTDAARAFHAIQALRRSPRAATAGLRKLLSRLSEPSAARLKQLIADLDSDQFAVRERAAVELDRLAELARPALEEAQKRQLPAESRRRIESLLGRLVSDPIPIPEVMRERRAVEVLEHIGSTEARALLADLAKGAPQAVLTREARAAVERLERKGR